MNPEQSNENIDVDVPKEAESPVSLDDVVQDIVQETPDVQQHVVDAHEQKEIEKEEKTSALSGKRDTGGTLFDPQMHMVGDDGEPRLTKTGKFRKIPGITKKLNNPLDAQSKDKALADEMANKELESRVAAETVQGLKRSIYDNMLGYSCENDRHNLHVQATTDYFMSEGGIKLSPLHNVLLLEGAMIVEAMRTPKGQEKITGIKAWLANKWVNFKFRKKGKTNGAQLSGRSNDVGKNNGGNKDASQDKGSN